MTRKTSDIMSIWYLNLVVSKKQIKVPTKINWWFTHEAYWCLIFKKKYTIIKSVEKYVLIIDDLCYEVALPTWVLPVWRVCDFLGAAHSLLANVKWISFISTHCGWVMHICISKNITNWTPGSKLQWNLNRNSYIFIQESAFENVVWKMAAMLSRPQCVK